MRIFCAIRHARDSKQFYGGLWSANFYPALRQLGHEIIQSAVDLEPASRFMQVAQGFTGEQRRVRASITQQIVDEVKLAHRRKPVQMFLSYFYNSHFNPAGFEEINRLGITTVNFYCNGVYQFDLVNDIASAVQYSWHTERDARQRYLQAGARPVWVQFGADPELYRPVPQRQRRRRACFVGQRYADRDRWAAHLLRAKLPVDLYGAGWSENGCANGSGPRQMNSWRNYPALILKNLAEAGPVGSLRRNIRQWMYHCESRRLDPLLRVASRGRAESIPDTFAAYEVVLNFSNVWADGRPGSTLVPHVRLRDFEAPMCRTCYLTGRTNEIAEFYKVGLEIDTYGTPEELADKARFYLAHPDRAERLREAGYQRALRDHTWARRFEQLFRAIGLQN